MGYIKSKGIIIKEINTGEADKIVTVLTRNQGKITGFAKGARRTKSRLSAGTQFLCYSELLMFKGKDMYTISSYDVIEPFYNIRNDIIKLTYCAHIVDIINHTIQEEQPAAKTLQLFLNSLHMLSKTEKSPELITRIFELKFLSILGYAPRVKGCLNCGREDISYASFSFKNCGILCSDCLSQDQYALSISRGTAKAINYIIYSNIDNVFSFDVSSDVLSQISSISKRYLRDRLERDFKKLDFLKQLDI